jgi:hypothetical protein
MTDLVVVTLIVGWVLASTVIGVSVCMLSSRLSRFEEARTTPRTIRPSLYSPELASTNTPDHPDVAPAPSHN